MVKIKDIIKSELNKKEFNSIKLFMEYHSENEIISFIESICKKTSDLLLHKASEIAFEEINNGNTSASEVEQKILKCSIN